MVKLGKAISRSFFERPCLEVAPDLVGLVLLRREPNGSTLVGRIVEVEAYLGVGDDPASHAHRGETPRNSAMFGPPGNLYVYRSHGIHLCANIVCENEGSAAAVLLRAIEPLEGIDRLLRNRNLAPDANPKLIASGPGRLTQAFNIRHDQNGRSALRGPISLRNPPPDTPRDPPIACPRIGITKATTARYRFCARNTPHLSKPIPATHHPKA